MICFLQERQHNTLPHRTSTAISRRALGAIPRIAINVIIIDIDVERRLSLIAIFIFLVAIPRLLLCAAVVPSKRAADAVKPLGWLRQDGGEGVLRGGDGDVVPLAKLDSAFAVEGAVGGCARLERHGDAEEHAVVEQHRAEGERVGTDGSEEDGRDVGVHKGAAGGERVRC